MEEKEGDILAFLTGHSDIETVETLLLRKNKFLPAVIRINARFEYTYVYKEALKLLPCPLYGAQSSGTQAKVFEATPDGHRKVVLATNIAETSVTVPNIRWIFISFYQVTVIYSHCRFVVDCGLVKVKAYDESTGMDVLAVVPVAQSQARQRAGS